MKLEGVTDSKVRESTGRTWKQWETLLRAAGAEAWDHKRIVAFLKSEHDLSMWWQQTVTVGFEKAIGRRVVGQTADAGFQFGMQRTLPIPVAGAWRLITENPGRKVWLGQLTRLSWEPGSTYRSRGGIAGEVRVVKLETRVRMTWHHPDLVAPATLQWTLVANGSDKTSVRLHLEKLSSEDERALMKGHFGSVFEQLAKFV